MNTSKDREGWADMHARIAPLIELMKSKYPAECNIEGLEPALTSDIVDIAIGVTSSTRKETLAEVEKERKLVLDLATIIRSNIKSYRCGQHKKLIDKCDQVLSSLSVEEGKKKKGRYILVNNKPTWQRRDGLLEKYAHQDGDFSNLCASEYCRCQE